MRSFLLSKLNTPRLDKIEFPQDLRFLSPQDLPQLSAEIRHELISTVSKIGGHLGAGLGVVELTVALHYIFNTPHDRLIWDVGHQAYPHKILTGRKNNIHTLRQKNGLSGFTKRLESVYDPFGAGHSSTSISAGLGMAVAAMLDQNLEKNVISVIGDGAMSAGMAFEALNNAGSLKARLIVILNDNDMSIAPPTGAMSSYFAKLVSSPNFRHLRDKAKHISQKMPHFLHDKLRLSEENIRNFLTGNTLFSELGFYYVGPIDGHNFDHLLPVLKNIRDYPSGPILLHIVTQKGKGYKPAEEAVDKYHGVESFDIATGTPLKKKKSSINFTKIFAKSLIKEAEKDSKIVAITAAMPTGTGLDLFAQQYKNRMFDVGIAEQHAVTFAAGLACEGYKPFVAIYSTFLQRAYDQIVHDVSLQNLPVRFAIDRAGFVGADGPTHAGSFDISFLANLPNFVVMAPADENELRDMVHTAAHYDKGPIAFRYPRLEASIEPDFDCPKMIEIGKGEILKQGKKVALIAVGTMVSVALKAFDLLKDQNISTSVVNARFIKPLDEKLIIKMAREHEIILTIEEGARGGFGAEILEFLADQSIFTNNDQKPLKIKTLKFPDFYMNHGPQEEVLKEIGLSCDAIVETVHSLL